MPLVQIKIYDCWFHFLQMAFPTHAITSKGRELHAAIDDLLDLIDSQVSAVIALTEHHLLQDHPSALIAVPDEFFGHIALMQEMFDNEIEPMFCTDKMDADSMTRTAARLWKKRTRQFIVDLREHAPRGYVSTSEIYCLHVYYCEFIDTQKSAGFYL